MAVLLPAPCMAQQTSATADADASATIIDPSGITLASALAMPPVTASGGAVQAPSTQGVYILSGPEGRVFSVESPQTVALRRAPGAQAVTAQLPAEAAPTAIPVDVKTRTIRLAAQTRVPAGTAPGLYSGVVTVMMDLN